MQIPSHRQKIWPYHSFCHRENQWVMVMGLKILGSYCMTLHSVENEIHKGLYETFSWHSRAERSPRWRAWLYKIPNLRLLWEGLPASNTGEKKYSVCLEDDPDNFGKMKTIFMRFYKAVLWCSKAKYLSIRNKILRGIYKTISCLS